MAANKRKILEAARKHAQKGAKEKALKEFGKLLKLDPRDSKVRLEMGDTHRRWGQVAEAIEAYSVVADQFMNEGFDARAVAVFKQIQNLQPDGFAYHEPLAELYQRMGLTAEAIGSLEAAAEAHRAAGRKQEALGLLRKMAAIDPSNTTSRIKVADLLQQEGMKEDAIAEYDAVIEELEQQGDTEASAKLFERILEIEPKRIETLVQYARYLINSGSVQRAESLAKRALDLDKAPDHYELLADVYRMQQRDEELIVLYRELAELYRERGDEERTREILQRYVPLDSIGSTDTPNGYIDENENLGEEEDPNQVETLDDLSVGDETMLLDGDLLADSSLLVSDDDSGLGILSSDDDLDDLGSDNLDLITDSNEMTTLLPDEPSGAGDSSSGADDAAAAVDIGQLLAEASVYLRYGKRPQAIANLESILERDSNHRLALEKLGEALAEGDDSAKAVEMWSRAARLAAESGEGEAAEVLRNRIAALDSAAAEALDLRVAPDPEENFESDSDEQIDDVSDELSMSDVLVSDSSDSGQEDIEGADLPELDLADVSVASMDIEIDIDDASFTQDSPDEEEETGSETQPEAPDSAQVADGDLDEISIDDLLTGADSDESGEVEAEDEVDDSDDEESSEVSIEVESAVDGDAESEADAIGDESADAESLTEDGAGGSDVSPEKIAEELEEADFYMEQGLLDEAEAVYSRILSIAPNHPHAMVRLGELAAQRGDESEGETPAGDTTGEVVDSAESVSDAADESGETDDSDIGADLADWQEDSPAIGAEEASEQPEAFDSGALDSEESSASADLDVDAETGVDAEADGDADADVDAEMDSGDIADISAEAEEVAGEDLVAAESDLAADLGLDESVDLDLGSEDGEGESVEAGAQAAADESPSVSAEPEISEEPDVSEASEASREPDAAEAPEEPEELDEPEPVEAPESPLEEAPETLAADGESGDDGDNFGFDLAAELSESFDQDPDASGSGTTGSGGRGDTSEDGFASVFAEFKKGVSETLNEGDHQAHYDLGIAYREMGLLGDAITELRLAMSDPERRVGCLHLMGMCANEMGEPEQAIGHLTEALASDGVSDEIALALKLDLGSSHEAVGDIAAARRTYEEIQAVDPDFADVAARLDELAKPEEEEPAADDGPETEEYESFAEFLGDLDEPDDADAEPAAEGDTEEAPAWETFDDVIAEVDTADEADSAEPAQETEQTPKRRKKKISFV
ncbi:MAG: tetratricopeptide repeat protein [Deltaproteobacteria bacterium]|nr:tetratricopeptide repeat protein [Deltaproteobacteria bacterium]